MENPTINVRLPTDIKDGLYSYAHRRGIKPSEAIRRAIETGLRHLKTEEGEEPLDLRGMVYADGSPVNDRTTTIVIRRNEART